MTENKELKKNIENFCDHLDIEYQVDFVREYEKIGDSKFWGGKHCGSDAEHQGSAFIAQKLRDIGLVNVELIPCETSRYQFNDAALTVGDEEMKLYGYVSPGTGSEGICAQIVDIGKATKDECDAADLEGRIAMFEAMGTLEGAALTGQMEETIDHGAAAILICAVEDVLNEDTIRVQPPNLISTIPIVGISGRHAKFIKEKIAEGSCEAKLVVDADFVPDGGTTYNVTGEIPGKYSDERIIYTAHLDHYFRCLQDNISTCSTLLGIAKAMVESEYEPNRTITFAFHGSHETGGQDTRYPYIFGSYKLTHVSRPEWTGQGILNINFEYTALHMKKLQQAYYLGAGNTCKEYFPYAPELIGGGFEEKIPAGPATEYYMLSWSDNISYHTAGIPAVCNDPISEQYYEGTGAYVGRDHSNYDNWEIFDEKILEDVGRYYGGLGIFADSMPYLTLDFTEQTDRLRAEVDPEAFAAFGFDMTEYFAAIDRLEAAAEASLEISREGNEAYIRALEEGMSEDNRAVWFAKARVYNKNILETYKLFADEIDRINEYDFISLASIKYLNVARMFSAAVERFKEGDGEKGFEAFAAADLVMPSLFFSESVVEHMRKRSATLHILTDVHGPQTEKRRYSPTTISFQPTRKKRMPGMGLIKPSVCSSAEQKENFLSLKRQWKLKFSATLKQ